MSCWKCFDKFPPFQFCLVKDWCSHPRFHLIHILSVVGIPYALHQAGFGLGILLIIVVAGLTGKSPIGLFKTLPCVILNCNSHEYAVQGLLCYHYLSMCGNSEKLHGGVLFYIPNWYLLFVEEHFWRWGETTLIAKFMASESLLPDGTNEIVVYHW